MRQASRASAAVSVVLRTSARMLPVPILPVLTCNPNSGLGHYQRVNGNCFNAPAVGTQGGQNFPYMSAGAYFNNDLAIYRSFHIHEKPANPVPGQRLQLAESPDTGFQRIGRWQPACDWLTTWTTTSKAITKNYNTSTFGVHGQQDGAPYPTHYST